MRYLIGILWFWSLVAVSFALAGLFRRYDPDGYEWERDAMVNHHEMRWRMILWILASVTYWVVLIAWKRSPPEPRAALRWSNRLLVLGGLPLAVLGLPVVAYGLLLLAMGML